MSVNRDSSRQGGDGMPCGQRYVGAAGCRNSAWLCLQGVVYSLLIIFPCAGVYAVPPTEYEVKAAFIHNIAKYVEWPESASVRETMRLCILGHGPFGEAAAVLGGRPVGSKVWEVVPASIRTDFRGCQVLLVEASEAGNLPRLLDGIKASPIMTVGDTEGYAEQGVMVNFYLEQSRVRFEINLAAARRSGLEISSQLLKLARIISPAGGGQ